MTSIPAAESTNRDAALAANGDIRAMKRVLELEAEGILALARALDGKMVKAVDLLAGATGRIVVTGMGKSGHIARKIAATMASTGTPALFVHPAEASHGDLGMITAGDAVIALSNSGGTPELADVVAYTRRFGIPLIALTSGGGSALAEAADAALVLPQAAEACSMGLAPTTSTTMMLALGDAIAVALLERKGFSPTEFKLLHPGGQLGRRLLRVSDIMHGAEQMPLVKLGTPMTQAILEMTAKSFGCVGITNDGGELVGIVTDGDLRRHMSADLLSLRVDEVMTGNPRTIRPQALAAEALGVMNNPTGRPITSLFVVDGTRLVGLIHMHDCLRAGIS
jgi:arabinose-5-phosphate isomerase